MTAGRHDSPRVVAAARAVAWGTWLVAILAVLSGTWIWALEGFPPLPVSFAKGPANVASVGLIAVVIATMGALLAARLPRNLIGWLLLVLGLIVSLVTPMNLIAERAGDAVQPSPTLALWIAWLASSLLNPVVLAALTLVVLLFPDGRFVPGRWWIGGVLALVGASLVILASLLDPAGLFWYPDLPNPAGLPGEYEPLVVVLRLAGAVVTLAALAVAAWATSVRYRRSDPRTRLQLRWIVFGVAVVTAGLVPFLAARYFLNTSDAIEDLLMTVLAITSCTFPITIAIAINRQHLFEIDTIISRTLVYVPLMGLLAGLYAASIALFQRLFISITGNSSDAAIVISSLLLAGVFSPTRSTLEAQVSRHFKPVLGAPTGHELGEPMPSAKDRRVFPVRARPPSPDADAAERLEALTVRVAELERRLVERGERDPPD